MVRRFLVVANQTLGGRALDEEIKRRIDADCAFFVLVPLTNPLDETDSWFPQDPAFDLASTEELAEAIDEALRRSHRRLELIQDRIRSLGGRAEGTVGMSDPVEAVRDVLARHRFDEVIVSTLPRGLSRWLRMDLPSKVAAMTAAPVVAVEARD